MTSRENAKDAADGKPNPPSPNDAASKLPPADTSGYLSEDKKPIQPLSDTQLWDSPAGETASICDVCHQPLVFPADDDPRYEGDTAVTSLCRHTIRFRAVPEPVPTEGAAEEVGDYSCATCGFGMQEPCEHWKRMLAQPSAEGDDASGIVPYLVGQIAALGPSPAGSRTNELFALLHEAIDPLRAEGDGWIAEPTEQGWWWHIDAGEHTDMIPFMYGVMRSGTNGKMFIQYPDSRWCSDVGGLWAKATPPPLPAKEGTR